jgi:hypothetical protein
MHGKTAALDSGSDEAMAGSEAAFAKTSIPTSGHTSRLHKQSFAVEDRNARGAISVATPIAVVKVQI